MTKDLSARAVILGASNVTLSGSALLECAQRVCGAPSDLYVAAGLGRSYGERSAVLGRALPGILRCRLWEALVSGETGATFALVTDVGNDILYGHPVDRIADWVECCIDRLLVMDACVVLTPLPMDSLGSLGSARYQIARQIFFPSRFMSFETAMERSRLLDERIRSIARGRGVHLAALDGRWYGLDPIHIRRSMRSEAWEAILAPWRGTVTREPAASAEGPRLPGLRFAVPDERWILGVSQHRDQPWRRLPDGSGLYLF